MPLVVHCQNGHRIVCPDELAGSNVRCPQCLDYVEVSGRAVSQASSTKLRAGQASSETSATDAGATTRIVVGAAREEAKIVFACPNGHRLSGSPGLEGQQKRCPQCGAQFTVPSSAQAAPGDGLNSMQPEADSVLDPRPPAAVSEDSTSYSDISLDELASDPGPAEAPSGSASVFEVLPQQRDAAATLLAIDDSCDMPHPLTAVFRAVWQLRQQGATIRLELDSGSKLLVDDWFEARSVGPYAVLLCQNDQGRCIEIVPWDRVCRLSAEGIAQLPDDWAAT